METLPDNRVAVSDPLPVARRKLSWGAIIGGVFTTLAVNILMLYFGSALGLSIFSARDISQGNLAIPGTALAWLAFTVLVSGFLGAWVAGRWSNVWNRSDALLHGALTWAVGTVAIALMSGGLMHLSTMAAATNEFAEAKPNMQPAAPTASNKSDSTADASESASPMTPLFYDSLDDKNFTEFLMKRAQDYAAAHGISKEGEAQNVSSESDRKAPAQNDDKQTAKRKSNRVSNESELIAYISANTNMSEKQAKQFIKDNKDAIAQAQNDSEQAWAQANAPALARADEARKDASGVAWTMFGLAVLALAASLAGARFGFEQYRTRDVEGDDEIPAPPAQVP
jgi:hypothetical protein